MEAFGKVGGAAVVVKGTFVFVIVGVESASSLAYISFVAIWAGHPRTPMTPLGKTQPTNNEHTTMHALLL
jgi:hypothetical protein